VYESAGVQPVFVSEQQAIDYATGRACFRSGEIRILACDGGPIAAYQAKPYMKSRSHLIRQIRTDSIEKRPTLNGS
jgi:hypothetical protein